jgi:hypothetical protein
MAWRFDKMVIRGEIDNTVRGSVTGTLWLLGREQPMTLDLVGDAWPDLAGCKLTFENPNPMPQPQYDEGLAMIQTGSVGDITASQKLKKLLVPEEVWMKALEERRFHEVPWVLHVSERQWELDEDEQAAQQAINEENMRTFMEDAARALGGEDLADEAKDEDGPKPH